MIALSAFLSLLALQPAPPSPMARERILLDAFRGVCEAVDDYPRMRAAAAAAGWEPVEDGASPLLARINQVARQAAGDQGRIQDASYRRVFPQHSTLHLVVSRWEGVDRAWGNGCRVYDFEASRPIDPAGLTAWMGRAPTGRQDLGPLGSNLLWEPGWREGMSVSVNHVPPTSVFRERYGLSGNVLVAQAFGPL